MLLLLALVGCRTKDLWDSAPVFVPDSTVDSRPDSPVDDTGCEQSAWYRDADSDGYGAGEVKMACDQPDGFVAQDGDCNDEDAAFHPGAPEEDCTDPEDYNCDGSTGYADADGDGYPACEDCDDEDATRSPGEEESCNGIDDDCDGSLPEEEVDDDGDGLSECEGDCDDTNDAVNPTATEICNGIDDDCEGSADGPDAVDASTWYEDADEDGFGSIKSTTQACEEPSGYTSDNTDCDDTDGAVNPDGTEVCDGVDNDCDGSTDDDGSWWDSNWPYRLPLTLTAASTDVEGPPVLVEVDFAAHLATLGASGTFDANSLRVVIQDCDLSQPELTSQFLDAVEGLAEQQDHAASTGDSSGTVAFLYDEDGDVGTLETLIASSTVEVALYFATSGTDPSYISKLSASTSALTNSQTSASFEASRGGLLDTLVWQGTQVSTQTDSCCGNGNYSSTWSNTPMYTTGTVSLIESGPVVAVVQSESSLSGYDATYWYWLFDARPELWVKVYQETTGSLTLNHAGDFTLGMRPWETRRDSISSSATFTTDTTSFLWSDINNGTMGLTFAWVHPPAYGLGISDYDPYLIVLGNDLSAATSTTVTVSSGEVLMGYDVLLTMPYSGTANGASDARDALVEGVSVSAGSPEAL